MEEKIKEFEATLDANLTDEEKAEKIAQKKEELEEEQRVADELARKAEEDAKNIDFQKELDKVQKPEKSELEKAQKALHFNALRLVELGGDPADVLKLKKEDKKPADDVQSVVQETLQKEMAMRDARALAKNEDHLKLIMHYVENNKLSVQEAYLLSVKGTLMRSIVEAKRANVEYAKPDSGGRKVDTVEVPERSQEETQLLERRGMRFNPKTKTYQGRFYEEYFDSNEKVWKSRKLVK